MTRSEYKLKVLQDKVRRLQAIACCDTDEGGVVTFENNDNISFTGDGSVEDPYNFEYAIAPTEVRDMANRREQITLVEIEPGSVTSSLEDSTSVGAMSSATISAVGGHDKFEVTGGNYDSYILFPKTIIYDQWKTVKIKFRVANINKDGSSNVCIFGAGVHSETPNFPQTYRSVFSFDLYNKTPMRQVLLATATISAARWKVSSDVLASNGDIMEFILRRVSLDGALICTMLNLTTGAWLTVYLAPNLQSHNTYGTTPGNLRINMANGDFTLLSTKVTTGACYNPHLQILGDSFACGYLTTPQEIMPTKIMVKRPWDVQLTAANSSYFDFVWKHQRIEVLKMKAKYVALFSILVVGEGEYEVGHVNNATFMTKFNDVMNSITIHKGIPIVVKWDDNSFSNSLAANWSSFIDTYVVPTYPTTLVLDLRNLGIVYNDSGHPNAAGHTIMADKLIELLDSQ